MYEGHQRVMPYLIVPEASDFIEFMKTVFDAKLIERHEREDGKIKHGEMQVGEAILMFADTTDEFHAQTAMMYIYCDDTDAQYKKAMENGCSPIMEPYDEDYGARSAGVTDPYGNIWWMATLKES